MLAGAALAGALLAGGATAAESRLDGWFPRGLAPVDLGDTTPELASSTACADCHPAIAAEWAASQHGRAWTDPIFQREYRLQPLDWCVRCHAPLATGGPDSVTTVSAQGVNCAVCHVRDGQMLATSRRPGSPHDTVVAPELGTAAFCGVCHQFAFPVVDADQQVRRYTAHPMQDTVAEFRAGARSDTPGECLGCHGNTPARHGFPGSHADGALQHALTLDACRAGDALRVSVTNVGAGHAVPTGDLHRHAILRVWRSTAPERLYEARIGRLFEADPAGGKRVSEDTSIRPAETRTWNVPLASLGPGTATDDAVNVELRYVYTVDETPLAQNDPGQPTSVTIHSRRLPVPEVPPCR